MEYLDFGLELKAVDEPGVITGLASTYGNLDLAGDIVDPGAFSATLSKHGPERPLLWSHDVTQPVGLGTLKDTPAGLELTRGELDLETQAGRETYSRTKKRIVKGLSIGFKTIRERMQDGTRHLLEIDLMEVSLVVFPANTRAMITGVKSSLTGIRDFEKWLHEAGGFSRAESKRLASHGFEGLTLQDEPEPDPASEELAAWLKQQRMLLKGRAA